MMPTIKILACICLSALSVNAAPLSGRIFVDTNGNGLWDKGEKSISGVIVSDGLNVTESDKNGSFQLSGHPDARFVFVTTPSGYKTMNRHYLPVDTTAASYDFGLIPYDPHISRDGSHRFIQITDSEIFDTADQEEWIANIRDYAANESAAFIIHTGDICYENGLNDHIRIMNTRNMGLPVYYCIGNHDLVNGRYGEGVFEDIYGPVYYSFDVAGTHYVVTPMENGDVTPSYTVDDVCRWLRNDLAHVKPGTPVIIFNHDLPFHGESFIYKGDTDSINLNEHNLKAWIYGHWHINHMKKQGNVLTISTSTPNRGGIDHSTNAYRVIDVDKNGNLSSDLRYTYLDRNLRIASPQGPTSSTTVTVNAYSSTSPVREVSYTCLYQGKTVIPYKPLTKQTDWTWTAEMPLNDTYTDKELVIRVKCLFKDGRSAETDSKFILSQSDTRAEFGDNWTNLLGNSAHNAIGNRFSGTPSLLWTRNVGSNIFMTSPLIYDRKIYTASTDENHRGNAAIFAYDGSDGRQIWKYPVANSIKNSIAIDRGILFAQDVCGQLYAVDAATGSLRWQTQLPVRNLPALIDGLTACDGVVYAGSGESLSAFDAATGRLIWRNTGWKQGEGTTSTLTVGDGMVIGSAQWSALHGNDAETGRLVWSLSEHGLRNRGSSAAVHGSLLYLISRESFFIINARTGDIIVRKQLPYNLDVTSTPLVTDSEIIFGTADKGLVALDRQTLELKWNTVMDNALLFTAPYSRAFASTIETSPVLAGDTVIAGASDGTIYAVNTSDGKITWKYRVGAPILSSPALSGNTIVITDFGGNIYLFTLHP